jgi:hypothetical protein
MGSLTNSWVTSIVKSGGELMPRFNKNTSLLLLITLMLAGCDSGATPFWDVLYHPGSTPPPIIIKMAYVFNPKFLPHTEKVLGKPPFFFVEQNLNALFPGRMFMLPHSLAEMQNLGPRQGPYTPAALTALSQEIPDDPSGVPILRVVFVDGYFVDAGGTVRPSTAGDSPGKPEKPGTYAWIFLPVISDTSPRDLEAEGLVQQWTLAHEIGHAIGLVNHGVPMVTPHEDAANPGHDTNEKCIMYWVDLKDFAAWKAAAQKMGEGSVVFDPNCQQDMTAYRLQEARK